MSVRSLSNNRVLPDNSRSVDVARSTINRILPIETRRYDNAFRVQGYTGIFYSRLEGGERCLCKNFSQEVASRLDENGKADPGLINSLLTGGMEFGILPYGTKSHIQPKDEYASSSPSILDMDKSPEEWESSSPMGTQLDVFSNDSKNPAATTILVDGMGVNGPISADPDLEDMADHYPLGITGHSDVLCPICFGTSFVGGFQPLYGWRKVLTPSAKNCTLEGFLDFKNGVPLSTCSSATWENVEFPVGFEYVDSLALYSGIRQITWKSLSIDGQELLTPFQLRNFCDGHPHSVRLDFEEETTFTHLELQVGISGQDVSFELPKQTTSGDFKLLEQRSDFSVVLSPLIPMVKPKDVLVESTTQGCLQVKSLTNFHDKSRSILGWEVEVRAVQPQEILSLLPRRNYPQRPKRPAYVRDNMSGRRT